MLHAEAGRFFSLSVSQELDRRTLNLTISTAILKEERTREETVRKLWRRKTQGFKVLLLSNCVLKTPDVCRDRCFYLFYLKGFGRHFNLGRSSS